MKSEVCTLLRLHLLRPIMFVMLLTVVSLPQALRAQTTFTESFSTAPNYSNNWVVAGQVGSSTVTYASGNFRIQAPPVCTSPNSGTGITYRSKQAFVGNVDASFQLNHGGYGRTSVGLVSATSGEPVVQVVLDTDDTAYLIFSSGSNSTEYTYSSGPYLNRWITLRIQIDGSQVNFYANNGNGQQLLKTLPVPSDSYYLAFGAASVCWKSGANDSSFRLIQAAGSVVSANGLLVTSANANSVFQYDSTTGGFLRKFDSASVNYAYGAALGPDGYLYTASTDATTGSNSHIDRFDPVTGVRLASFGALPQTRGLVVGPDGLIYVSAFNARQIWRYDPKTSNFVDVVATVVAPYSFALDPAGNLYVNNGTGTIFKFDSSTHAMSTFISDPNLVSYSNEAMVFGPDGKLYLGTSPVSAYAQQVRIYNGQSGAFEKVFAQDPRIDEAISLAFGPDGRVYVGTFAGSVLRFDRTTGAFIDVFVPVGSGGLGGNITGLSFFPPTLKAANKPQVLIVPGILGTKLAVANQDGSLGRVVWASNKLLKDAATTIRTGGDVKILSDLQFNPSGLPVTPLKTAGLMNLTENPTLDPSNSLSCLDSDVVAFLLYYSSGGCRKIETYNALVQQLEISSYPVQAFEYDWRFELSKLADQLRDRIIAMHSAPSSRPVAIVAHSMGGLIVGECLRKYGAELSGKLDVIVTLGTPYKGSLDAYMKLRGWDDLATPIGNKATQQIGQYWPSVYELLPRWNFLRIDGSVQPDPDYLSIFIGSLPLDVSDRMRLWFPPLPSQNALITAHAFWNATDQVPYYSKGYALIGSGFPTAYQIKKDLTRERIYAKKANGDGTVPLSSSRGSSWIASSNTRFVKDEHAMLPSNPNVISALLQILAGNGAPTSDTIRAAPFASDITLEEVKMSPVDLSVSVGQGSEMGPNARQVAGGKYFTFDESVQVWVPSSGSTTTSLVGTGPGIFTLVVRTVDDDGNTLSETRYNDVPVKLGSTANVKVIDGTPGQLGIDFANAGRMDFIPANVFPPTVQCTGCYFLVPTVRATVSFNVGYLGAVSTFSYNFRDSNRTVQFVSTTTTQIAVSANTATFSGQGTLNGQSGYAFNVTAKDGGAAGSSLDNVSVTITGPNNYSYSANGTVLGGDIVVKQ